MTNLVFSRRDLQRLIDDLSEVLEADALASIVVRLNEPKNDALAAMWEVVFLAVLARAGSLEHEQALPDGRKPDFALTIQDLHLVGDITTLSDWGLDKNNPIELFQEEIVRLARKHDLPPNGFRYDVRGERAGGRGKERVKLFLPPKGQLPEVMRREVEPWLRTLKSTAAEPAAKVFKGDGFAFAIQYDPKQSGFAGGHLSYDIAASLTENPLFRALSAKADQLRAAPEDAIRLVIACDGDCNVLRSKHHHATSYSAADVARDFLRQRPRVDLVLLVTVRDASFNALAAHRQLLLECELVGRPETQSLRLTQAQAEVILKALSDAIGALPTPVQHPYNAVERLKRGGFGPDRIGGYERGGNRVKLSSRAVQRLLAGDISTEAFAEAHWDPKHPNPFLLAMQRGQVIKSVRLEDRGPKDDDWLEFTFGYDVAQAPFVASAAPIAVADADANSDDSET